jgi:acyl-CoA reductase-like NAD-dependent aldehyde dehydrogenase
LQAPGGPRAQARAWRSRTRRPARRCARSPTRVRADALDALSAAADAQAAWGAHPPRERGEILRRAFELIGERTDELAMLMSLEMGKSLVEARGEVAYANDFLRWFSEEAVRIRGSAIRVSPNGRARLLTMRQPVGPCLLITPWNFPLAMGTRKIGPAIAAGCTMVVKPAKQTPLSMLALGEIFAEAGLPAGVLNIVTTSHAGAVTDPLFDDPRLRKLSFTGSTEVGRLLARARWTACCASRWSSAATPRCSSSRTPTSSSRSTRRCWRSCATWARPAPPPTASTSPAVAEEFAAAWRRGWSSCASAAASTPTPTSAR